eukprot:scaffold72827_cov30-Phaeocystis_antarctica.AAC.1
MKEAAQKTSWSSAEPLELAPGRPRCAAAAHFQQNPRRWKPDSYQGDHTQLGGFWSQMRCRRVLLLASRISVVVARETVRAGAICADMT